MEEVWRDVKGYEGLYQVSNMGRVKSVSHYARNNINGGKRYVKGRVLMPYKMPNGYLQIQLSKSEKRVKIYLHRLVAIAFLENKNGLSDVNHVDGNKENNCIDNLEWVTHKDNQIHMIKNRMTKKATPIMCVETNSEYNSLTEAEKVTGINRHALKKACETETEYKGLHWRFSDGKK